MAGSEQGGLRVPGGGQPGRTGPRAVPGVGSAELIAAARHARRHARAPFSRFKVGAALETTGGHIVTGCNIESATYGLTMCAERVAMFKALSEGRRHFLRLAVVTAAPAPTPPCGACRQVLWEFAGDIDVILATLRGPVSPHRLSELLPLPFDRRALTR